MIKWKDFLYFSKGDRIAIILLSILICATVGIYLYLNNIPDISPTYIAQSELLDKNFTHFENEMTENAPLLINETEPTEETPTIKKTSKSNTQKLKEGQTICINSAYENTLMRIPGIGETLAQRIADYRNMLGGFVSLEQLQDIKGITIKKYSNILPYIVITKKHKKININRVSSDKLSDHPYLNEKQVAAILSIRNNGKITSIDVLNEGTDFSQQEIDRLKPYLSFE